MSVLEACLAAAWDVLRYRRCPVNRWSVRMAGVWAISAAKWVG